MRVKEVLAGLMCIQRRLLFPVDDWYMDGDTLGNLRLTWYSNIDPGETVEIVNTLWQRADAGETVFYDLYSQEEKAALRRHCKLAYHGEPPQRYERFGDPAYTFSVPMGQLISGVIRNLRAAMKDSMDYTARSNLMWDSTLGENRLIKMGKRCDFQCHNMDHQLGAYTSCNQQYHL